MATGQTTFIDLTGQRFGRLVALDRIAQSGRRSGGVKWICQCDCGGAQTVVSSTSLRSGNTKSCGCLHRELMTKQFSKPNRDAKAYLAWGNMRRRCSNPSIPGYANYGGRGISVCKRWDESFDAFFEDMGECPKGFSIERKNNNGNYEPGNCVWETKTTQANNARSNIKFPFGVGLATLAQICDVLDLKYNTVHHRMSKYGWTFEEAISK